MAAPRITPIAVYEPLGWQQKPLRDKAPTLLVTGSAGGGKSVLLYQKLHAFCLHYEGAAGLALRKVKASMTNSTVLNLERTIIGRDPNVRHYPSKSRFEYRNGSILAYAGMEDEEARERIKSIGEQGGLDIVGMEEGSEFEEEDYNILLSRMRGTAVERHLFRQYLSMLQAGRATWRRLYASAWCYPYLLEYGPKPSAAQRELVYQAARQAGWQQIIVATNPDSPMHWIYRRLIQNNEAAVYMSRASDNRHNPLQYNASLEKLTGVDHDRLVKGLWVQATGIIFDTFDLNESVTSAADYVPGGGPIFWAVDDGYAGERDPITGLYTATSHPRVFLIIQQRSDGGFNIIDEHHTILTEADQQLADVMALPYPLPDYAAVDKSAAQLKGKLFNKGIYTRNSPPSVEESIKEFRSALAKDANGWRKFLINPRCKLLISEFGHYRRDANGKPIKQFDHALDAGRYFAWTQRAQ